jgi:hypothetical protein
MDARDCELIVAMPHRHGGVASMLAALRHAEIKVTRIEPRGYDGDGMYRVTVSHRPRLAVVILEGVGCRVTGPACDLIGIPVTPRVDRYPMTSAGRTW